MMNRIQVGKSADLFHKELPAMPEVYYSGDKPNPNLKAFVEQHMKERPYDPLNDNYNIEAFTTPIKATKATAIYNMHTYWSKKPHDAIRQYIRHYTQPGDLVLDPMCGSGSTALAALMEGRKAIAIDLSPAATFITKNYCTPVDTTELEAAFAELKGKVKPEIDWLYETRCDRCGGKATTSYTVYSQVFQCPRCMEKVPLFDCVEVEGTTAAGKPKKVSVCPHCYEKGFEEEISTRTERFGSIPVLVSYICENGCHPARDERRHNDGDQTKREYFRKYDLGKIKEIEEKKIPYWYPPHKMMNVEDDSKPWGAEWRQGRNFRTVAELFTKRNLWALALIKNKIMSLSYDSFIKDWLLACLTGIILGVSKMNQYRPNVSFPLNIMTGTYYLPQVSKEEYILKHYENKVSRVSLGIREIAAAIDPIGLMISTADMVLDINNIQTSSIDYIFTDPPYGGNIQYGELNFIWEAWLHFNTKWHDNEIIINELRGKTEFDWANMMRLGMAECYRVLKPGRWISICYHDTSEGTWALLQDIMAEIGFVADRSDSSLFIDTGGLTYNQTQAEKVTKRDLVINFRKPKPGEIASTVTISGEEGKSTFTEKVHAVIRDYLSAHPGASKDRIYDEVVSHMVRSGAMEKHNFDELLRQIADEVREPVKKNLFENKPPDLFGTHEISRWYLKETQYDVTDAAESAKEDAAAEKIASFIKSYLRRFPEKEGAHYSDIFEEFVYKVHDKPRRSLVDWLSDYFYKAEDGTYRLPQSDEEERLKSEGRKKGTSRLVRRYIAFLQGGTDIPEKDRPGDATLAEWIRHCKRAGLYEQGKYLYEKGGLNLENLSEETTANVEEDYEVCVRMLNKA